MCANLVLASVCLVSTFNMDALKRKAKETLGDIQRAENKHKDLVRYLRLARERADLAEEEAESLKEKIKSKREELKEVQKDVAEKEQCHVAKEEEAEESETTRKALEAKEFDVGDELVMLERKCSEAKKHADEKEDKLNEAKIRYSTMKANLSELLARLNAAESKIVKLSEESDSDTVRLINLEIKHRRYDKREEYFEDKIETNEQQIRNLEIEAVKNEAETKLLEVQRDKVKSQLNSWKKRVANLSRELEDCKADLHH